MEEDDDAGAIALPVPQPQARAWTRGQIAAGVLAGCALLTGAYVAFRGPSLPPLAVPIPQQQPQPQPADPRAAVVGPDAPVLVRFSLDNSYPDSELPLVDAALQVLPAREVPIAAPTAVADLIRAQYAIRAEGPAGLYARLDAEIRRRSEIVNGLVAPGTARIPLLPPFTAARNNLSAFISVRTRSWRSRSLRPRS